MIEKRCIYLCQTPKQLKHCQEFKLFQIYPYFDPVRVFKTADPKHRRVGNKLLLEHPICVRFGAAMQFLQSFTWLTSFSLFSQKI